MFRIYVHKASSSPWHCVVVCSGVKTASKKYLLMVVIVVSLRCGRRDGDKVIYGANKPSLRALVCIFYFLNDRVQR